MGKWEKIVSRMRENPRDWKIGDFETVASNVGIQCRKSGGSHVVFHHPSHHLRVTVPASRPIKPVYVALFLELVDLCTGDS